VILGLIDHDLLRSMAVYFFLSFPGWDYPFAKPRFAAERGDLRLLNAPLPSPETIAVTPSIRELPFVEYEPGYRAEEWIWRPLDHSYLHRFAVSKYRDLVVATRPAEEQMFELNREIVRAFARQTMLDGAGIPYTDMTPCLTPLSPAERFPADGRNHFAPAGNAAVAACLRDSVRALLLQAAAPAAPASRP
jgi:hypothetical protein